MKINNGKIDLPFYGNLGKEGVNGLIEEIENMNLPIFEICLEQTHINMAITKILGMIRANKIRRIVFASVDKSPHCIQLHYIQDEIRKLGFELSFENYVAVNNALIKISKETITLSKNLSELSLVNYR